METIKFTKKVTKILEGNTSKLHDFRIISNKNNVEVKLSYKNGADQKQEDDWIYNQMQNADSVLESIRSAIRNI